MKADLYEYDPDVDDDQNPDGWAMPPFDPATGNLRIMASKCSTCIFRPGNPMHLEPGRVGRMLAEVRATDSFVTCHQTLGTGEPGAICAGSSEAHCGQIERIARRLDAVVLVEPSHGPDEH